MERAVVPLTLFGLLLLGSAASQPKQDDWDIRSFHINSTVTSRYATTIITSRVTNSLNESKEIEFQVQIPKNAFISKFRMFLDNKVYDGVVKTKEQALQENPHFVSKNQSSRLVSSVGRTMEEFKTSVTVAAHKKVTFELTYEELLKRTRGKYELLIHARPMQPVQDFKVYVYIHEKAGVSYIDVEGGLSTGTMANAITRTHADKKAWVTFYPTVEQQKTCDSCGEQGLNGDLVVVYDVNRDQGLGDIERAGGYFVHHFAPSALPRLPKKVVFVIDQSGSMQDNAHQAHTALMTFLNNLAQDDLFGLIAFNGQLVSWKQQLVRPTKENLEDAKRFAFRWSGATNINKAVLKGAHMLKAHHRKGPVSILILLTDGEPTSGETNLERIRSNVRRAIAGKFPLYCLGLGSDVNFEFLEKMSLENDGVARWIHEDDDANLQLKNFFEEVATPLLTDVTMGYVGGTNLTQTHFSQYYNGSEIVVAGQIMDKDTDTFFSEVVAISGTDQLTFSNTNSSVEPSTGSVAEDLQRVWAHLTVKQLLEKEMLVTGFKTEKAKNRAVELSLKYGFMTPLTSMVITKPLGQNTEVLHKPKDGPANPVEEDWIFPSIGQYRHTPNLKPHVAHRFMIKSKNQSLPLCYDVKGAVILKLLDHPRSELKMYGFLDSVENGGFEMILIPIKSGKRLTVRPKVVELTEGMCTEGFIHEGTISAGRILVIRRNNEIEVSAEDIHVLILVHEKNGKKFLWPVVRGGASVRNNKGLLGLKLPHYTEIRNDSQTKLIIKGKRIPVKRTSATDYNTALPTTSPCWLIPPNHALQRPLQDFIIDETE